MTTKIVIIGGGPGGYAAAARAAQLGAEVALIEAGAMGGTCLNRGCIPSKIMVAAADMLEKFKRAEAFGIKIDGTVSCDIKRLMERKNAVVRTQIQGIEKLLKQRRVRVIQGRGLLKGPGMAAARLKSGKIVEEPFERLILACGTRPAEISGFPFDGRRILSSDHALNLNELPASLLIVGGGVIGCEFAFIMSALGVDVTLVEAMPRLLPMPSLDEECSAVLQREMKKRRIRFFVNRIAEISSQDEEGMDIILKPSPFAEKLSEKDRKPLEIKTEKTLICVGRTSDAFGLKLENIGLSLDSKGWIEVDEKMETAISGVYAVGDILGPSKIMLAHVASAEGLAAAENAVGQNRTMDYSATPSAIFTSPEVACVGLSQRQAEKQGKKARSAKVLFRSLGKAQAVGEIAGQAKIVYEADNAKILGVHIIGPHASELIAEACLAIKTEAGIDDLARTIHAHPTMSEIMPETAFKALGRPLHG